MRSTRPWSSRTTVTCGCRSGRRGGTSRWPSSTRPTTTWPATCTASRTSAPAGTGGCGCRRPTSSSTSSRTRWVPTANRRAGSLPLMSLPWPELNYPQWQATCDTLHAHTQVLGKLAAKLAPPEPQLQHAALRLTTRGWGTLPLPAPDGSGALTVALDLHRHEAVVEHSDGRAERVPLTPNRPVGEVTRGVLAAARGLGGEVDFDPTPQEVPWTVPLDEAT